MKQVSRCQPLRYGTELSSLAMSGIAFSVALIRHSTKYILTWLMRIQRNSYDAMSLHHRFRNFPLTLSLSP